MAEPQPPGPAAVAAAVADPTGYLRAAMPLCATLGFEAEVVATDRVVVTVPFSPRLCTANGAIHGGTLMAMADAGGALLAYLNLPAGAVGTTTIESKTNFLGAARGGIVSAASTVLHAGRTTIVIETVVSAEGRVVAKTTQTQLVLQPRSS